MKLFINGKEVSIDKVQDKGQSSYPPMQSWVAVYVNGFASCHNLPAQWFNSQARAGIKTSGNLYEWKQEGV